MASPVGKLGIGVESGSLVAIDILSPSVPAMPPSVPLAEQVVSAINPYFQDPWLPTELPLAAKGTAFQRRVWDFINTIAVGETMSYGEVARRLHTSARAVGCACRTNPIPILVPCHRVVAAHGLGGYMGDRDAFTDLKRWLLEHERRCSKYRARMGTQ